MTSSIPTNPDQVQRMRRYYRLQSKLYDWTRWSFLFGRNQLIRTLPFQREDSFRVLEIGCGTGHNLRRLARHYPNAQLHGIDVSSDMLRKANKKLQRYRHRLTLEEAAYGPGYGGRPRPDVILISYCLTMVNPGWQPILERAIDELGPSGVLAVVDFHDSPYPWFKRHMGKHHVRMEGQIRDFLQMHCGSPMVNTVNRAYGGTWEWLEWIHQK